MGATRESLSRMDAAELDELRRRAYGPEADIWDDADAVARLTELELLSGHGGEPIATSVSDPEHAPDATPAPDAMPPTGTPGPGQPNPAPQRGHHRALLIAATAATVFALAAGGSILTSGSSDVTLYRQLEIPQAAAEQLSEVGQIGYMGVSRNEVHLYDEFKGLYVWSAPRGSGSTCLFVTSATPPRWRVDCASEDGRPTIDLLQYREDSRLAGLEALGDVPEGYVLRLSLQDGAVVVRIVEAPTMATIDG